jgi:hypothetical protein
MNSAQAQSSPRIMLLLCAAVWSLAALSGQVHTLAAVAKTLLQRPFAHDGSDVSASEGKAACAVAVSCRHYACENILIHELGHAVMNLGFNKQQVQRVRQCYSNAKEQHLYDPGEQPAAPRQHNCRDLRWPVHQLHCQWCARRSYRVGQW